MNTFKQVDETLNSINNIQRAEANPLLYQKVMQRLNSNPAKVISIKPSLIWSAAACLALLVGINIFTCITYTKVVSNSTQITATASALAKDYFSTSNIPQF